jgi:hypothetical protein
MAGWDDSIFSNLPPRLKRGAARVGSDLAFGATHPFTTLGNAVFGGMAAAPEAAESAVTYGAGKVGVPNPAGLGREVRGMIESPTFGGGMSPLHYAPEVAMAAAPLAATARTATEIATGRRSMADVPDIRTLPVDQGIAAAQGDPHLVVGGGGSPGYYMGGPASIQSPADLATMRQGLDARIAQGQMGADWYDRERRGLARTTGNDQPFNDFLSKAHGSWSQGVDPQSETAFVTKEAMSAASGKPERAMYQGQHDAFLAALDANNPNLMQTGKKTDEYASHLNPLQPSYAPTATGVNDFRMGQEMGFTNSDAEERAGEFSLGDTQHKFMDYETALATQRANAANLGGRSNWTGEQIQASPWTIQKAGALQGMRKNLSDEDAFAEANKTPSDFDEKHAVSATYEQQPAAMLAATGHTPQAGGMTAKQRADYAADPGAAWASAPSFGLEPGELPRDVIYGQGRIGNSGMGLPTLPTMSGTGYFKNAAGDLETNPMFVARPLTPFHASTSLSGDVGATLKDAKDSEGPYALLTGDRAIPLGQEKPKSADINAAIKKAAPFDPSEPMTLTGNLKDLGTWEGFDPQGGSTIAGVPPGNKATPDYARDMLNTGELIRSYFGAQEGGAWHKNWAGPTTGGTTGYFTPLDRAATPEEMTALSEATAPYGMPDVTSSARGITTTSFGDKPQLTGQTSKGADAALERALPQGAEKAYPVRTDSGYAGPAWGGVGAGTATDDLLAKLNVRPELYSFFNNNADIGRVAGGQAQRDAAWASTIGDQRPDIFNARTIAAADPEPDASGWADRLAKARRLGVPAAVTVGGAAVSLYPTAGLPSPLPGMTLNSPPPDWWRQQQNQMFSGY